MFNFLKDKLKSAVDKVTKKVEDTPEKEDYIEIKEPEAKKEPAQGVAEIKDALAKEQLKEEIQEKGFFKKVTQKITTKVISESQFNEIFQDIEIALLENNVGLEVIDKIKADLKEELLVKQLTRGKIEAEVKSALRRSIKSILTPPPLDLENLIQKAKAESRPFVILIIGFNGAGKSLTSTKLAFHLKQKGHKPILAAADTFRAAGASQLVEYGKQANIPVIEDPNTNDSCSVIFDTIKHAKSKSNDVVIADTSGRIQNNQDLMDELKKISRVNNPDVTLLVVDSLTGSDVVTQVDQFDKNIAVDGLILTKADVDEKGGAFLSAVYTGKKPVLYIGSGQLITDFKEYNPDEILEQLGL